MHKLLVEDRHDEARELAGLVERLPASKDKIRKQLAFWRDNQAELIPVMQATGTEEEEAAQRLLGPNGALGGLGIDGAPISADADARALLDPYP